MAEVFDLQRLRRDAGVTQKQLADLLEVPQSFISQVENHRAPMPPAWKDQLASTYNISDISEYTQIVENGTSIADVNGVAGVGVSVRNDISKFLEYLKTRDAMLMDLVHSHNQQISRSQDQLDKAQSQIDRLINLLEKK